MPTDKKAISQWDRSQHAYEHYLRFIAAKPDHYALTITDLIFVKNFKGGSATIAEPVATLTGKLQPYEKAIRLCAVDPAFGLTLASIPNQDYGRVRDLMVSFSGLPELPASDINGFGCSFASALLHFYFPEAVPILDKRALNGAGIQGLQVDKYNNVLNLLELYPALIDACRTQLQQRPRSTLRQLDRALFIQKLNKPPFQ
jgi:hypothetical protein